MANVCWVTVSSFSPPWRIFAPTLGAAFLRFHHPGAARCRTPVGWLNRESPAYRDPAKIRQGGPDAAPQLTCNIVKTRAEAGRATSPVGVSPGGPGVAQILANGEIEAHSFATRYGAIHPERA